MIAIVIVIESYYNEKQETKKTILVLNPEIL